MRTSLMLGECVDVSVACQVASPLDFSSVCVPLHYTSVHFSLCITVRLHKGMQGNARGAVVSMCPICIFPKWHMLSLNGFAVILFSA